MGPDLLHCPLRASTHRLLTCLSRSHSIPEKVVEQCGYRALTGAAAVPHSPCGVVGRPTPAGNSSAVESGELMSCVPRRSVCCCPRPPCCLAEGSRAVLGRQPFWKQRRTPASPSALFRSMLCKLGIGGLIFFLPLLSLTALIAIRASLPSTSQMYVVTGSVCASHCWIRALSASNVSNARQNSRR